MAHVHFIGIGGSGLSAIARLLLESGYSISGSDRVMSPFAADLERLGARVFIGHAGANVAGADWVVRSSAIPDGNPEVVAARAAGIPVYKRADFLGRLMEEKTGIAVAGTHGKTTTTAMLAWTLYCLQADPSFIVGGVVSDLGVNARFGRGAPFVIEADEYDRMFLGLKPRLAIITNVEHDHPDCYPTSAEFFTAFEAFARLVPPDGVLIVCADDPGALRVAASAHIPAIHYGIDALAVESSRWVLAQNPVPNVQGGFTFEAAFHSQGSETVIRQRVALRVPGRHNVLNALAVLAAVWVLGYPLPEAAAALEAFSGAGRRFDVRGEAAGVIVVDDYGHHPTEIRATLSAARARYGSRRIWAVWQPHTYSRTQMLAEAFAQAFGDADRVLVTEIYRSREAEQAYSSRSIVEHMAHPAATFTDSLEAAAAHLAEQLVSGDVLIVFSAGDADRLSQQVFEQLKQREVQHGR